MLDCSVVGGFGDNDSVTIENSVSEALCCRRGVCNRDDPGLGLTQLSEDDPGRTQDLPPLRNAVVDRGERNSVAPRHEIIGILKHRSGPADRRHELLRSNAPVCIGIDERGGLGIKFDARGRTRQGHPEFLVQLVQVHEVGSGLELHLIKPAGAEELPEVRGPGGGGGRYLHGRTAALVTTNNSGIDRTPPSVSVDSEEEFTQAW